MMHYIRVSFEDVENHPHLKELIQEGSEVRVDAAMFDWVAVPENHPNIDVILLMLGHASWIRESDLPNTTSLTIRELFA